MSDIRALTLIGNTTRRPIRHALAKEKLTNHIKHSINHQKTSPHSNNPHATRAGNKKRAHPKE